MRKLVNKQKNIGCQGNVHCTVGNLKNVMTFESITLEILNFNYMHMIFKYSRKLRIKHKIN